MIPDRVRDKPVSAKLCTTRIKSGTGFGRIMLQRTSAFPEEPRARGGGVS
jgi:hypothetical protein